MRQNTHMRRCNMARESVVGRGAFDAAGGYDDGPAQAWRPHCRAPGRGPGALLQRRGGHCQGGRPISAPRCPRRRSMSTTTIRPTVPSRSPRAAGALVRREMHQGKGNVVRRMFADVDADIYVLVDGDATYDAPSARVDDRAPDRRPSRHGGGGARRGRTAAAYRRGHRTGNRLLTGFFASVFNATIHRYPVRLSGVLAPLREVVSGAVAADSRSKPSFPSTRSSSTWRWPRCPTPYYARLEGSVSKLSTWRDGVRILVHHRRPLSLGAAAGFFLRARHRACARVHRSRDSDLRDLLRAGHGAAHSDGDPFHRPDAVGLSVDDCRARCSTP